MQFYTGSGLGRGLMTRGHLNTDLKGVRGQATVTYRQRITSASAMALRWGLPGMFEGQREGTGKEGEEVRSYGNGVDQMRPCLGYIDSGFYS